MSSFRSGERETMSLKFSARKIMKRLRYPLLFFFLFLIVVQIIVIALYHLSRNAHYVSLVTGIKTADLIEVTASDSISDVASCCNTQISEAKDLRLQTATEAFNAVGSLLPTALDICCSAIISLYAIYQTCISQKQSDTIRNYEQFYNAFNKLFCEQGVVELSAFEYPYGKKTPSHDKCLMSSNTCFDAPDNEYYEWSICSNIHSAYLYTIERVTIQTDERECSFIGRVKVQKTGQRICFCTGAKTGSPDGHFLRVLFDEANRYRAYRLIVQASAASNMKAKGDTSIGQCMIEAFIVPSATPKVFTLSEIHINEV